MDTTPLMGVFTKYRHQGINLLRATLATWDKMKAAGMQPYGCNVGMITMQPYYFRKAFAGRPATKLISRDVIMYSVWDGHVEITCIDSEKAPKEPVIVPCHTP